jgi:hypothetical protein
VHRAASEPRASASGCLTVFPKALQMAANGRIRDKDAMQRSDSEPLAVRE